EMEDISRAPSWQVRTGKRFAKQILCPSQPRLPISGAPVSLPTCRPCWKLPPAMPGLALLGLAAVLGVRAGAPLWLSRQLSWPGDYMLGGSAPLDSAEDALVPWAALGAGHDDGHGGDQQRVHPDPRGCAWATTSSIRAGSPWLPLVFMAKAGSCSVAAYCDYMQYQPHVLAVIGPHSFEVALVTSFFLMLHVSYGASTDWLSSRETFPSFLRTVPSDRVQVAAVVELLRELHWSWVATVGSEDEYSWQGLCLFSGLADAKGTCIAREGRVPLPRAGSPRLGSVQGLPRRENQSSVQVVSYSIRYRLSPKMWVASEAWLPSNLVMTLPSMDRVGTVLGVPRQGAQMPEFPSYVQTCLALATDPAYCASLDTGQPGLEEHVCDCITLENVTDGLLHRQTFAPSQPCTAWPRRSTTYCSATPRAALCGSPCGPGRDEGRWEHNMHNLSLRFDTNGNVDVNHDLKLARAAAASRAEPEPRGPCPEPVPQCSRQCKEGQVHRVKGFHSCCYDGADCKAGSYQRNPASVTRTTGPQTGAPVPPPPAQVPGAASALGPALGLVLAALGLFIWRRHSPWFGPRACSAWASSASASSCFPAGPALPAAWPSRHCTTSCSPDAGAHPSCRRLRSSWGQSCSRAGQTGSAAACGALAGIFPPEVPTAWQVTPTEALVHCHVRSWVSFGLVHATNATLAFLCFLGTFPPAVQMGAILFCVLGILGTSHLPKCYLLLWRPDLSTPEFFLGGGPGNARGRGSSGGGEETQGKDKRPLTQ
ncbi:hypothetical protein EI555_019433, partial [Monodon monoceros]